MLSQSTTTVQQPFCSTQIVMVDEGLSSVAIKPLNPTDKNSLVNVIFQVINMRMHVYMLRSQEIAVYILDNTIDCDFFVVKIFSYTV